MDIITQHGKKFWTKSQLNIPLGILALVSVSDKFIVNTSAGSFSTPLARSQINPSFISTADKLCKYQSLFKT